jgi:hypothetical protein
MQGRQQGGSAQHNPFQGGRAAFAGLASQAAQRQQQQQQQQPAWQQPASGWDRGAAGAPARTAPLAAAVAPAAAAPLPALQTQQQPPQQQAPGRAGLPDGAWCVPLPIPLLHPEQRRRCQSVAGSRSTVRMWLHDHRWCKELVGTRLDVLCTQLNGRTTRVLLMCSFNKPWPFQAVWLGVQGAEQGAGQPGAGGGPAPHRRADAGDDWRRRVARRPGCALQLPV